MKLNMYIADNPRIQDCGYSNDNVLFLLLSPAAKMNGISQFEITCGEVSLHHK